jgi:hypothetical protein
MSSNKKLDQLIDQMENHLECWKQFNHFVNLSRAKRFGPEEDNQFLEIKSVIVQQLELILACVEVASPTKDEILALIGSTPSLRCVSELNDGAWRNLENQWHRIYIAWHSILGQLKVKQRQEETTSTFASIFGKKEKG